MNVFAHDKEETCKRWERLLRHVGELLMESPYLGRCFGSSCDLKFASLVYKRNFCITCLTNCLAPSQKRSNLPALLNHNWVCWKCKQACCPNHVPIHWNWDLHRLMLDISLLPFSLVSCWVMQPVRLVASFWSRSILSAHFSLALWSMHR